MRAHIIENGIVTNTIEVESLDFMPNLVDAAEGGAIGWLYDGEKFTPPEPTPEPVPSSVTMRQARLALHAHGKLAAVQDAINLLSDPPKTAAQIEWDYASVVERASPFVAMLTPALGMTDAEMDELFREAATL